MACGETLDGLPLKGERADGTFSRSDFTFDPARTATPAPLKSGLFSIAEGSPCHEPASSADMRIYRSSRLDCAACPLKDKCCLGQPCGKWRRSLPDRHRSTSLLCLLKKIERDHPTNTTAPRIWLKSRDQSSSHSHCGNQPPTPKPTSAAISAIDGHSWPGI